MNIHKLLFGLFVFIFWNTSVFAQSVIRVAIPYPLWKIDPLATEDPVNRLILSNIGKSPMRYNGDQSQPELVDSIVANEDFTSWLITFKPDIYFADGAPLTASSFRASLEFYRSYLALASQHDRLSKSAMPQRISPLAKIDQGIVREMAAHLQSSISPTLVEKLQSIATIESPNDTPENRNGNTLRIKLKTSQPSFDKWVLSLPVINGAIAQSFGNDYGYGTNSAYLGPYYIKSNRPQVGVTLEAVRNYYQPTYPRTTGIEFRYLASSQDALSALRTGAIDIIALPTQGQLDDVRNDSVIEVIPSPFIIIQQTPRISGGWKLYKNYWSDTSDENDKLLTNVILLRRTLELDYAFHNFFDLSGITSTLSY